MKHKPPLLLMEQMIMLLVFALAAALCLQAFVKSDRLSKDSEARDRAVSLCQSTAEALRHSGGDFNRTAEQLDLELDQDGTLYRRYDKAWTPVSGEAGTYLLRVQRIPDTLPGLGKASVSVSAAEGDILFALEVAWQEVSGSAG